MNDLRGEYPCPRCACPYGRRVTGHLFLGIVGAGLFHPVKCVNCDKIYNARTGRPTVLKMFLFASVVLLLVIFGFHLITGTKWPRRSKPRPTTSWHAPVRLICRSTAVRCQP